MLSRRILHTTTATWRRIFSSSTTTTTAIVSPELGSVRNPTNVAGHSRFAGSYVLRPKPFYLARKLPIPYCLRGHSFSSNPLTDSPVDGVVDVPLAQTGEGIAECELLKWYVQEGDKVEEFQPLCEVQSDKATIEITSRYKGKVSQVLYVPGDIIKVGETLLKMVLDEPFSTEACRMSPDSDSNASVGEDLFVTDANKHGILSTPAVRNLAKQHGIDIDHVFGTGKDGRVLKEDVLNYAASKGIQAAASNASSKEPILSENETPSPMSYQDTALSLRGFQRAMVKSMTLAAKIPHFHFVEEVICDKLAKLKTTIQNENSDPDIKYTFLPFLIKSLSMALFKYPMLNSCFDEGMLEVTLKGSHNIGIAMATPSGLVVPNIKNVQLLSIFEITKELSRLQKLALSNKLHPEDISGGTITLSNIGAIGGKFGSPLINVPEVSIIALGRIQKVPQFDDDGKLCPLPVMTINIAADHRILDGATVATFCKEWKSLIERPELLLLHMR